MRIRFIAAFGLMMAGQTVSAQEAGLDFYEAQVAPIFEEHCVRCHGGKSTKAELNLTYRTGLMDGGERGTVVNLDAPDESLLLAMLSYKDGDHEMPPEGKLADAEIGVIRHWIAMGLPMPDEKPEGAGAEEHASPYNNKIDDETRNWWSYRPVTKPAPPAVPDPAWSTQPIDQFIYDGLMQAGLTPAAEASRATLIRRVYYGLTGLPPTPEDVQAFVNDPDPAAYEKLVDRMLASPHYGEKWGRHWLDLVRYAETNGYERDNPKPEIWRYRDYVVNAFNKDKPYDRFIREQLAGDELADGGTEGITATGYYRLGIWDDEPVDKKQGRYDVLDGVVGTTAEVFLGMTMSCARCHDHKIDPMPQSDYYKFLAFFDNVTDMHTTDITRMILEEHEKPKFEEALQARMADVARQEARIRDLELEFVDALEVAEPELARNIRPSDMTNVRYWSYRDTWTMLPEFDRVKFENDGVLSHNFFDIGKRQRDQAIGLKFEADLHVPADGEYVFHLDADDGARILVDGQVVVDYDGMHTMGQEREGRVQLTGGQHAIRLEYFQNDAAFGLYAAWSGPGFTRHMLTRDGLMPDLPKLIAERGDAVVKPRFSDKYAAAVKRLQNTRNRTVDGARYAACVSEFGPTAPATFVHYRGNPNVEGDQVQPGFPAVLGLPDPALPTPPPNAPTTGRRTVLADWIASPANPLTPRVMANRIWQYHFGRGLVRTPNDFGQAGLQPTHPELLEWLAADLMEGGWTLKRMHRMILLSRAYRMGSGRDAANYAKDPGNEHFWRFDMRRLTAEEVRDSILAVNGAINLAMGGPSVYPPMPREVLETSSTPDTAWKSSPPEEHTRRSLYIHLKRSLLNPLLTDFDLADTDTSCPVRFSTTQPLQALNLLNSEFVDEQAQAFARRLEREAEADAERVRRALELVTGRAPTETEVSEGVTFVAAMQAEHGLDAPRAMERFALLALNLNEFVFLD